MANTDTEAQHDVARFIEDTAEPLAGLEASFAELPGQFYARVDPTPVQAPQHGDINTALAESLDIDAERLTGKAGLEMLAGNRIPQGAQPIAMAYAGHQFGNYVPQLGDGRAVLLGEHIAPDGERYDIQLKGAGKTPFSRMGDGRAELFPVIAEYLGSEAMAGLGIPTTRSLGFVHTGEYVVRERPLPGAVLTRVARSHIRIGTFEYFARQGDSRAIKTLADYVIDRHYPELKETDTPYAYLIERICAVTGDLIANWLLVGFIHGVLNTDNISVVGETIDYGPFAWMDAYHPMQCFSQVDVQGRYAFMQQPPIGEWNLCRLAECLLPLLDDEQERAKERAQQALEAYAPAFEQRFHHGLCAKIGLAYESDQDLDLASTLLQHMAQQSVDYTLCFRRLSDSDQHKPDGDKGVQDLFTEPSAFDQWAADWRKRLAGQGRDQEVVRAEMRANNPAYILRKHQIYRAYYAVRDHGDYQPLEDLLHVLRTPYDDHPGYESYAEPPRPEEYVSTTFCGT
jgi:uncharacterized protein YdiU (UPF0061 family)